MSDLTDQGIDCTHNFFSLIDQSYITGYKTAEILRNGTKTDTWELAPLKSDPSRKTSWQDVSEALNGGTIYFNTAGSLWPNLGGLCRMTSYLFGLPTNLNGKVETISEPARLFVKLNLTGINNTHWHYNMLH